MNEILPIESHNSSENISELKSRLDAILEKLFPQLKEKRNKDEIEAHEHIIEKERKFLNSPEILDIYMELAIWINTVYQEGLLNKNEAEFLMQELRQKSNGHDNYTTLKIMTFLAEIDLYKREKE